MDGCTYVYVTGLGAAKWTKWVHKTSPHAYAPNLLYHITNAQFPLY